ncbi:MAG TPA: hypothetical protein VHO68_00420, partial [Bacteroidales bacterium]|nr:hypothetical protein [Bacteroidales bacterium]
GVSKLYLYIIVNSEFHIVRNPDKKIHHRPMAEQKRLIENEFLRWKGHYDQVDDITVVGVRI